MVLFRTLLVGLAACVMACEPRKPAEPKPPIPKVDFTHERSLA
jgi:hypothetical protein